MNQLQYRIYIPTRGRVDKQITVQRLPEYLHYNITLVCPKSEVKALRANYPSVYVLGQPDSVTNISEKRAWIEEQARGHEPFWFQADDDLSFYVFQKSIQKHRVTSEENEKTQRKFWLKTLPELCAEYDSVGIGTKGFALPGGVKENYHLGFFFGMKSVVSRNLEWNRIPLYEDIDYTLQLLKLGYRIAVTYDMTLSQRAAESEGGMSSTGERNDSVTRAALAQLINLHPECVKEKAASGQHSMSNTRISWKKAAEIGQLLKKPRKSLF